ncbi:hypothetical protein MCOR07_009239 [Pyricularia oryzae]|nr:hypothetical protein MCOR09_009285 [Pyricularia oryzae]KAI6613300.1 hypothetical protein MCOR07_009239 [Pyricularia oryzae]
MCLPRWWQERQANCNGSTGTSVRLDVAALFGKQDGRTVVADHATERRSRRDAGDLSRSARVGLGPAISMGLKVYYSDNHGAGRFEDGRDRVSPFGPSAIAAVLSTMKYR